MNNILCVEIVLKNRSFINDNKVTSVCESFLKSRNFEAGTVISKFNRNENLFLHETVDHIIIGEFDNFRNKFVDLSKVKIEWFLYTLDKKGFEVETDNDVSGEDVQLATVRVLPCAEYLNTWENLVYDSNVKENLLSYASTAMLFADKGIDANIISCNRVVLLHGPPGTGKTSLCKALAHKLTIRLSNRYKRGFLLEINSHSLFSKWFSESGKLVTKMFSKITEYLTDPDSIIFVLIDEIESLTRARDKSLSGVEPSDSIRVVNAVLTHIDQIKNFSNVLILTTSNMTNAIDLAFVDRADITQFIDLPSVDAIFQILYSCIEELFKVDIIKPRVVIPRMHSHLTTEYMNEEQINLFDNSKLLYNISSLCIGLSGRTLRKLPFIAHSLFLRKDSVDLSEFLNGLSNAVIHVKKDKEHF